MRTTSTAVAAALVAALVAGCGGGGGKASPPSAAEGARVFAASCTGCHTLYPIRGQARAGGPLAGYKMTTSQLESFVRNMPVPRPLSDRELKAVVAFVAQAQRAHSHAK
jgi:mono/diheme cytochrome c family protein